MTETASTSSKCLRCGRALTAGTSVARGYGRSCGARIRTAAEAATRTAEFKPAQVDKAVELIEAGAIVPMRGRRVFAVVSSNGLDRYLTAPQSCTCAAGLKGQHVCYHRVAAHLLAAA